jgi:hypothetical protein
VANYLKRIGMYGNAWLQQHYDCCHTR